MGKGREEGGCGSSSTGGRAAAGTAHLHAMTSRIISSDASARQVLCSTDAGLARLGIHHTAWPRCQPCPSHLAQRNQHCQLNGIAQKGVGGFERAIDGILAEYVAGDRGLYGAKVCRKQMTQCNTFFLKLQSAFW